MNINKTEEKKLYFKKIEEMRSVCNIAFDKNLIDTCNGNISSGLGKEMLITKTGASLLDLKIDDITLTSILENDEYSKGASSELEVHKFILKSFPYSSVFHAHPESAIALSLCDNLLKIQKIREINDISRTSRAFSSNVYPNLKKIVPLDFETAYFFPFVYIFPLDFIENIKSGNGNKINFRMNDIFQDHGIFMIRSHGSFAWGKTPAETLRWTMMLESSSRIILKVNGRNLREH